VAVVVMIAVWLLLLSSLLLSGRLTSAAQHRATLDNAEKKKRTDREDREEGRAGGRSEKREEV
jgi:hypothetical protein